MLFYVSIIALFFSVLMRVGVVFFQPLVEALTNHSGA